MKSVVDILGGAQTLLDISFDLQSVFEEYLCNEHRSFLQVLRIVGDHVATGGIPSFRDMIESSGIPFTFNIFKKAA